MTTAVGYTLFGLGCLAGLIGDIRFLVVAYRHGLVWLFSCLFLPFVGLLFFLLHMKETWKPVLLSTVGLVLTMIGYVIADFDSPS